MKIQIREGDRNDLPAITDIFNWHAVNGFATFSEPVSLENRQDWFAQFNSVSGCRLLVAILDSQVVGYACNMIYRGGGVFKNTTETSIYIREGKAGLGIGALLYTALIESVRVANFHRIVVGIAIPNEGSVALHRKFGFQDIGVFDEYAFYKGRYHSSLWMEKKL